MKKQTPCQYCQELTDQNKLYSFKIEDDEKIEVCLSCESYLSDIADGNQDEETAQDTKNEALYYFTRVAQQELQNAFNNW